MSNRFSEVFGEGKIVIGMIHLAGKDSEDRLHRALNELAIYREEGFHGAIIENFHGGVLDMQRVLEAYSKLSGDKINVGVNTLSSPCVSFELADRYGLKFIQVDSVMTNPRFDVTKYMQLREKFPSVYVLGGARFKYQPNTQRTLEEDLQEARLRCDAVVTTGDGTGVETPLEKLREFRKTLDKISSSRIPLVVGAGVNARNAREQLRVADGAIIGSYLKHGNTRMQVESSLARRIIEESIEAASR